MYIRMWDFLSIQKDRSNGSEVPWDCVCDGVLIMSLVITLQRSIQHSPDTAQIMWKGLITPAMAGALAMRDGWRIGLDTSLALIWFLVAILKKTVQYQLQLKVIFVICPLFIVSRDREGHPLRPDKSKQKPRQILTFLYTPLHTLQRHRKRVEIDIFLRKVKKVKTLEMRIKWILWSNASSTDKNCEFNFWKHGSKLYDNKIFWSSIYWIQRIIQIKISFNII